MKKEVVHVPTRELAEEVLRVAKENGLMVDKDISIWDYYTINTYFRVNKHGSFGIISNLLSKVDTIITAKEFLDRYKPKFRPIAMRCTQEQFDAVRGKLVGLKVRNLFTFGNCPYLVNNLYGEKGIICNLYEGGKIRHGRQVLEEWNEKTFLEYCGIDVKDEVSELEQLRKENAQLKEQLKAIEDQPKVGDACLFWGEGDNSFEVSNLRDIDTSSSFTYETMDMVWYEKCIKATPENIKAKIKELTNK